MGTAQPVSPPRRTGQQPAPAQAAPPPRRSPVISASAVGIVGAAGIAAGAAGAATAAGLAAVGAAAAILPGRPSLGIGEIVIFPVPERAPAATSAPTRPHPSAGQSTHGAGGAGPRGGGPHQPPPPAPPRPTPAAPTVAPVEDSGPAVRLSSRYTVSAGVAGVGRYHPLAQQSPRSAKPGLTKRGGYKSRAQWRWAFATRQPWAHDAAHKSRDYRRLPTRLHAPGTA